jgi:ABC-type multidrug transport system ATPase subunit
MEEVEALCDELAVVDRGRVIARGKVAELLSAQGSQLLAIVFAQAATPAIKQALAQRNATWSDDRHATCTLSQAELSTTLRELDTHGAHIEQLRYGVSRLHDVYLKLLEDRA